MNMVYSYYLFQIPHIEANDIEDGMFALGFVHAEDRLWFMYLRYLVADGHSSEVRKNLIQYLGEQSIKLDKFFRLMNFRTFCENNLDKIEEQSKKV